MMQHDCNELPNVQEVCINFGKSSFRGVFAASCAVAGAPSRALGSLLVFNGLLKKKKT